MLDVFRPTETTAHTEYTKKVGQTLSRSLTSVCVELGLDWAHVYALSCANLLTQPGSTSPSRVPVIQLSVHMHIYVADLLFLQFVYSLL